jgi:hypothetical protein
MNDLIYGKEYLCYFREEYIGTATFTDDPFIGDSFIIWVVNKSGAINEIALQPDKWILKTEQDC